MENNAFLERAELFLIAKEKCLVDGERLCQGAELVVRAGARIQAFEVSARVRCGAGGEARAQDVFEEFEFRIVETKTEAVSDGRAESVDIGTRKRDHAAASRESIFFRVSSS